VIIFRSYSPTVSSPISTEIFGCTYLGVGGSSSGGLAVAAILKYMSEFVQPLVSQGGNTFMSILPLVKFY
jgi:gamma-glutamyltranspeptidase